MKRPDLASDLVPVHEFRAKLSAYIRQVSESGRPIVLTQRGRAAAVLVAPAVLDELEATREMVLEVMQGLADGQEGRTVSSDALFAELEARLEQRGAPGAV